MVNLGLDLRGGSRFVLELRTDQVIKRRIESVKDNLGQTLRDAGVAIILVEQRIDAVLALSDRVQFIENGHSREVVTPEDLRKDRSLIHAYVGV